MDNLKPCPFCGGEAVAFKDNYEKCGVYCTCCNAMLGVRLECGTVLRDGWRTEYDTPEDAIAAWNRRPAGWIPVEERLPEKGECLVAHTDGTVHSASVIFGEDFRHCTHWMPLPQPPEGGGE